MPSTVIRKFFYHPAEKRLEVLFVTGRRYSYFDVPRQTYEAMKTAHSKGEFFNAEIRENFRFTREN
jgi:lysyl-tRNA synthetase class 2